MLRDVTCGALREKDAGGTVALAGWIRKIRDHGEIIFVDLWDRYGVTQVVFSTADFDLSRVKKLGLEWVIYIKGQVRKRPEDMINKDMSTGEIVLYEEKNDRGTGLFDGTLSTDRKTMKGTYSPFSSKQVYRWSVTKNDYKKTESSKRNFWR